MSAHTASIYHLFVTPLGGRHHGPLHQHVRHGHDHARVMKERISRLELVGADASSMMP